MNIGYKIERNVLIGFVALGLFMWYGLPVLTGYKEAWDSPWYYGFMFVGGLVAGLLGHAVPGCVVIMGTQVAALLLVYATQGMGKFGPLGLIMLFIWFAPLCFLGALLGVGLRSLGTRIWKRFS